MESQSESPFSLPKELKPEVCDFLFELYLLLRAAPTLSRVGRYRAFESAAVDLCKWHIDSISVKALEHLVITRSGKGLRRGHRMARNERGAALFDITVPAMEKDVMLVFFFENDRVTWVTENENRHSGERHWSQKIPVPPEYLKGGSWSVALNKKDLSWADAAWAAYRGGAAT